MAFPPRRGWRVAGAWISTLTAVLSDSLAVLTAGLALFAGGALTRGDDLPESVVLDFTASWCGPCQQMSPIVHKLERQGYAIRKIDVDQQPNLARRFRVNSIPTFVMVINGEERTRISGITSEDQLRRLAQQVGKQPPAVRDPVPLPNNEFVAVPVPKSPARAAAVEDYEIEATGFVPTEPKAAPNPAPLAPKSTNPPNGLIGRPKFSKFFSKKDKAETAALNRREEPAVIRGKDRDVEGAGDPPAACDPLAASVRIRVSDAAGANFGSGTIIDSRVGRTSILTCGHIFRPQAAAGKESAAPKTVEVDLFLPGGRHETYVGKVLDYDLEGDVGVVTIATAGTLPTTPLAPLADIPEAKTSLASIGCGGGERPMLEAVRVTALNRYDGPDNIECTGVPIQGRSGGGLFDGHGQLVGVCIAADQEGRRGLYAGMQPICDLLTRAGLRQLLPPTPAPAAPEPAAVPAVQLAATAPSMDNVDAPEVVFATSFEPADRKLFADEAAPTPAELTELFDAAPDAEVICIVRPKAGGPERVVILNQASTKFVSYLLDSVDRQRATAPLNASLRVDEVQDPLDGGWTPDDSVGVPKPSSKDRRAQLKAKADPAAPRISSRSRFGSRSAN